LVYKRLKQLTFCQRSAIEILFSLNEDIIVRSKLEMFEEIAFMVVGSIGVISSLLFVDLLKTKPSIY
jgi:hypothetical protein